MADGKDDPCVRCRGRRWTVGGRPCSRCDGTGVEPAAEIAASPPKRTSPGPRVKRRPARRRDRGVPRARTTSPKHLTREALLRGWLEVGIGKEEVDEMLADRPRTRGECRDAQRPCPWIGCRHHMYIEITPAGSIKFNYPTLEPWEMDESCCLDVADRGGLTLEAVGELTNLTRERARQIEVRGLLKLKTSGGFA